jgi:predicted secreted hydrolase
MRRFWLLLLLVVAAACATIATYRPVTRGYEFSFPRDYYAHPDFRTEWWYYTGHLDAEDGRSYGFELVFFRRRTESDSRFGLPLRVFTNPAVVANFALSDISEQRFVYGERIGLRPPYRGGARSDRLLIWSEGWQVAELSGAHHLSASQGDYEIDLSLVSQKPPALHGDHGYSRKGADGVASLYFSLTRMKTAGWLRKGNRWLRVVGGSAWMDHEILSQSLGPELSGWDWFSLQLDSGDELMLFLLRKKTGGVDSYSAGTYIDAPGRTTHLPLDQFQITEAEYWTSPVSGARYPVAWDVKMMGPRAMQFRVRALLPASELVLHMTDVNYWEGAVEVSGQDGARPLHGRGYVEMSGRDRPFSGI